MGNVEPIGPYLEPIRKSVVVQRTPQEAFDIFTSRIGTWWPRDKFSLYQHNSETCGIEPHMGGEIYEISKSGERGTWGKVLVWEPPARLVVTWHPGELPEMATELELRFIAAPEGTRVELEHRDWAKRGETAAEAREGYDGGWVMVFETCYKEACQ